MAACGAEEWRLAAALAAEPRAGAKAAGVLGRGHIGLVGRSRTAACGPGDRTGGVHEHGGGGSGWAVTAAG